VGQYRLKEGEDKESKVGKSWLVSLLNRRATSLIYGVARQYNRNRLKGGKPNRVLYKKLLNEDHSVTKRVRREGKKKIRGGKETRRSRLELRRRLLSFIEPVERNADNI